MTHDEALYLSASRLTESSAEALAAAERDARAAAEGAAAAAARADSYGARVFMWAAESAARVACKNRDHFLKWAKAARRPASSQNGAYELAARAEAAAAEARKAAAAAEAALREAAE